MEEDYFAGSLTGTLLRMESIPGNLLKWAIVATSGLVLLRQPWGSLPLQEPWGPRSYALALYASSTLLFTLAFAILRWLQHSRPLAVVNAIVRVSLSLSFLLDHLYVAGLVHLTGGMHSHAYLLFALLALKAAVYYPYVRELALITFSSGFLWVTAVYLGTHDLFFLRDTGFILRYVMFCLFIIACLFVGWLMERRQQWISQLGSNLSRKSDDLEAQAHLVQRTASRLALRVAELRSLQESVKAINSALAPERLLQLIVDNASQVLRGARCTVALVDEERQLVVTKAAAGISAQQLGGTCTPIGKGIAGWVVENKQPALVQSVADDPRFQTRGDQSTASLVCVPLISDGNVVGALTATSAETNAFTEVDVNLLDAFGDQAAIAVKNARLYEKLVEEEKETARLYQSVLEKSNELEAVLIGIGDGVVFVDPQLHLLMMNPVAARMFGVTTTPVPGTQLPDLVDNAAVIDLALETLQDTDRPATREITLQDDGERKEIYEALASSVRGAGEQVRGVVMVMRDVTSQKEIDQIKSDFLSVVSHELRTPLHSIKGFVDIILMGKTGRITELQRDFLTTVKESTSNLQRLIDDLLEFSRMEAGQIKLKPEMMSVHHTAEQVVERLLPLAQEGRLQLRNEVPEEVGSVEADPMRIEQVLTNLVSNAIKFTPEEGTVTISGRDLGKEVLVCVTDTGIGIPKEEQARVFQRFYQVDGSVTRSYRGAGLGLTICKFIVEYHHGRIWVESQVGRGSTFSFVLPKELPQETDLVIDFTFRPGTGDRRPPKEPPVQD